MLKKIWKIPALLLALAAGALVFASFVWSGVTAVLLFALTFFSVLVDMPGDLYFPPALHLLRVMLYGTPGMALWLVAMCVCVHKSRAPAAAGACPAASAEAR